MSTDEYKYSEDHQRWVQVGSPPKYSWITEEVALAIDQHLVRYHSPAAVEARAQRIAARALKAQREQTKEDRLARLDRDREAVAWAKAWRKRRAAGDEEVAS